MSGWSPSVPIISGCGGRHPGQILDKSFWLSLVLAGCLLGAAVQAGKNGGKREKKAKDAKPPVAQHLPSHRHDAVIADPTASRRSRREARGLPDEQARRDLAQMYLKEQRRLWPELVKQGRLPPLNEATVARLAEDFKDRFLARETQPKPPAPFAGPQRLGAFYARFSAENSNPRSLAQQLRNGLERARRDNVFIPWEYVFADAAVTGTSANRRGYQMAKAVLQHGGERFVCLYIDEIGRASRYAIEALRLGQLVERCGKRLVGASDGFDSATPHSKLMLSMFAMLHEWFVDQLRIKVRRGMVDAFLQGRNIHGPCFGYKLIPATDEHGHPIFDKDGDRVMVKVIDEEQAKYILEAATLHGEKGWSRDRIGRRFNELKVGGKQAWDSHRIQQLLTREIYVGVEYYQKTHQVRDPETGKVTVKQRPKAEWLRRDVPHLRIVSDELWAKNQDRLKKSARAYAKSGYYTAGRAEVYPKLLFRPICGRCGRNLWLGRSGKYSDLCCPDGLHGKHGCTFKGYKSVRIIETALLDHLREQVFTPQFLKRILAEANRFLKVEAKRPRESTVRLQKQIKAEEARRDRLAAILAKEGEDDLDIVVQQIRQHERRLRELRGELKEAEARNAPAPGPMKQADIETMLADLRDLLNEEVGVAAPILRELTGPIEVEQVQESGQKRPTWIAKFTINMTPVMAILAARRGCPTTGTWDYLNTRGWTMPQAAEVRLRYVCQYERFAERVRELHARGASIQAIASALGLVREHAKEALDFALTGKRPVWSWRPKRISRKGPQRRLYQEIAAEVARLRDEEHISFRCMAGRLGVSTGTLQRPYDYAHPEIVQRAVENGVPPKRGQYSHIAVDRKREVEELLGKGYELSFIAGITGVSEATVRKIKKTIG